MTREELDTLWRDPDSWRAWVIYYQPKDPRVIVPRRLSWGGWTFNFAHSACWWVGPLALASAVAPALIALVLGAGPGILMTVMVLSVVGLAGAAHWESTRDRT